MEKNESKTILSAVDIHKSYPMGKSSKLDVLKGIDLTIREGEILAIIGKSGVGKSTFLHILGALDRPTQGSVVLDETEFFSMKDADLAIISIAMEAVASFGIKESVLCFSFIISCRNLRQRKMWPCRD